MNPTLRFALALLVTATAAHAQPAGTGAVAPASMADSLHDAAPAPTDSLAPATLPSAANPPAAAAAVTSPLPSRPHVLAIRGEAALRAERDRLRALAESADADLAAAQRSLAEARGAVEIKKKDIAALDARIKAAKQARDESARTAAEGERRRQEAVRGYFEHLQEARDAAIDEAQTRGDYARAALGACDWELKLAGRSGLAANDGDPALFKLEQQYLDAVKGSARAEERFAARAQTDAERRRRLYRAWADWLGGR